MRDGFRNRAEAGEILAEHLEAFRGRESALVLGLPRGGAVVGEVVADRLGLPFDLLVVRKLGVPGREEFAMGAIAPGGVYLDREVIQELGLSRQSVDAVLEREERELGRRGQLYRPGAGPLALEGREVILVDDGLATGCTMRAAIAAARQGNPARLILAVPVGPPATLRELAAEVDEVICPVRPDSLRSVGEWYEQFGQTSDEEVIEIQRRHQATRGGPEIAGRRAAGRSSQSDVTQ